MVFEYLGSLGFSFDLCENRKSVLWSWMGRQLSCKFGTQLDRSDSEQSLAATTVVLMESLYVLALYFCALSKDNVVLSMKLCVLMLGHSC
jgi:hypothetical protein